ncbi:hypothetical protein QF042_004053 [Pedobacter sp. W3I1]|nr:hypothetical protein [Pedobacter sp. W3I1]
MKSINVVSAKNTISKTVYDLVDLDYKKLFFLKVSLISLVFDLFRMQGRNYLKVACLV